MWDKLLGQKEGQKIKKSISLKCHRRFSDSRNTGKSDHLCVYYVSVSLIKPYTGQNMDSLHINTAKRYFLTVLKVNVCPQMLPLSKQIALNHGKVSILLPGTVA